jgi:hypothetical protein
MVASLLTGCSGSQQGSHSYSIEGGALPADVFLAQYAYGAGDVGGGHGTFLSLFDEQTGKRVRDLVHLPDNSGQWLAGCSRNGNGDVWYVVAPEAPVDTHGGAWSGGAGRPSCGGVIYRLDHATGRSEAVLTVESDKTVSSPVLSPDGTSLSYSSEPCSYGMVGPAPQGVVVVRDMVSGRQRQLSVPGTSAGALSWSPDGTQFMFGVEYHQHLPHASPAQIAGFVMVASDAAGPLSTADVLPAPDSTCVAVATVFDHSGVALLEGCPDDVTAPAPLVQLGPSGRSVVWRANTGLCPGGASVVPDRTGDRLLISATATCGGPGAPVDVVQVWTGQHSQEIGRYTNPQQFVQGAVW